MPECPKCGKEIDNLREWDKVWRGFHFSIGENGYPSYEELDDYPECGENEWECPECATTLFYAEERAIEFLKGQTIQKEGGDYANSNRGQREV